MHNTLKMALLGAGLYGCGASRVDAEPSAPAPTTVAAAPGAALASKPAPEPPPVPCGALPTEIGRLEDAQLDEVSGVIESRHDPRVLFVHNDSGDSPRFFAIDRRGRLLAELLLPSVPLVIDAEDIALGPAPDGGHFVYLGDTGNNFASFGQGIPRRKAVLYRVREPEVPLAARKLKIPLTDVFPIVFTFPDGARDVEAFFIDPRSGDLFMISKQPDGSSQLLSASAAMLAAGGGKLLLVGQLRFGHEPLAGSTMPTSASVSRDGSMILIRTYSSVLLFRRAVSETVVSALSRAPTVLASPKEAQGEAVSFVDGDSAFLTISEGVKVAINCGKLSP